MLSNFNHKSDGKPVLLVAALNHSRERANFAHLSDVVDRPNLAQSNVSGIDRQPQLFSENLASLSSMLSGVSTERITVRIEGDRILQTVTYEWLQ
jgi:hypothetical protein